MNEAFLSDIIDKIHPREECIHEKAEEMNSDDIPVVMMRMLIRATSEITA